jgi:DNA-directed RNA polymerase specialized sigma24 family protein
MVKIGYLHRMREKEAEMIAGMYRRNKVAEYNLYEYCAEYYYSKHGALFRANDEAVDEIFQNSFIKLWENIESLKISAENNVVKGKDGKPLSGSIRTYFMGIAKLKYLEWLHEHPMYADPETEMGKKYRTEGFDANEYMEVFYGNSDNIQYEIIADVISQMSARCYQILTKFYYERKDLDKILEEIPAIDSKNALKSKKYKCMETLRVTANEIYGMYLRNNN